jgi:hypothetical protein
MCFTVDIFQLYTKFDVYIHSSILKLDSGVNMMHKGHPCEPIEYHMVLAD